jgi:hypothetical protein
VLDEVPVLPLLVVLPLVVALPVVVVLPVVVAPVPVLPVVDVVEVDDVPVPESIPGHVSAYAALAPPSAATVAATAISFRSSLIVRTSFGRLQIRGATDHRLTGGL